MSDPQEAYAVAWALFNAQCTSFGASAATVEEFWLDPDIRDFWLDQARIALSALALHRAEA